MKEETGREVMLVIGSDSTAGRGICQRHGVGNMRHLANKYLWAQERVKSQQMRIVKRDTADMTAYMLTACVEPSTLQRHCSTLNLSFIAKGSS